ncbi:hypothetical protein PS691_05608 [Pseudomonas fluorescens]|uniref:Uncharacterized protein n=1 Tax=Pseudomonas fluorescens TaxID=294 RepID=A0A5E7FKY4_PSEFL|nr:hypothetical protein PS691_05608 [Pseudomonas fluorescens]
MPGQCRVGHVFAAAHQGIGLGQRLELRVEGEGFVQGIGETLPAGTARPQLSGCLVVTDGGMASDRAFDQCQFTATQAGAFARRVVIGAAAGLPGIDRERLAIEGAIQGLAEQGVGNQAEAAGQAIAGQLDDFSLLLQAHAFQSFIAQGGQYVGPGTIMAVKQSQRLHQLIGPAWQLRGEAGDGGRGGLLGNSPDLRTVFFRGGGAGQQYWPAAGDHQAFAVHRQAALDQRLEAARASHPGQRPAREGQEQLAGAGAQNQFVVSDQPAAIGVFDQQLFRAGAGDHPGAGVVMDVAAGFEFFAQAARLIRQAGLGAVAPDLPARQRVVIEQDDVCSAGCRGEGGGHAGGPGPDDQQVGVFAHA